MKQKRSFEVQNISLIQLLRSILQFESCRSHGFYYEGKSFINYPLTYMIDVLM